MSKNASGPLVVRHDVDEAEEMSPDSESTPVLTTNAALVIIDVQRGFADKGYWGARNNPGFEWNLERLINVWEHTGRPIVVVRHDSQSENSPLRTGQNGNELTDAVGAVSPALVVTKVVNSSFHGTPDLRAWLEAEGIRQLVLAGIQTNMCVETTARVGGNLGFDVLVALDATHTFDLTGSDGTTMTADELATATAVNLSGGGFARIVTTSSLEAASAALVAPRD
ncbi:cysteine hydrolase family protein [Glaciibacter superstes]|uniref:cysteine hydrolase family protein n=1 Tax=Glaciibacter superstes TaxID=501023 RepID=UPI0003B74462|nr:cysteine hydrolase family protein [Glaciibacter superstes]